MDPITFIQQRDTIDWFVAFFAMSTGTVIALAGLLAFAFQRARYIREVTPDIEIIGPHTIEPSELGDSLRSPWSFQIPIHLRNLSDTIAEDIRWHGRINIFHTRGKSQYLEIQFNDKRWNFGNPKQILPNRDSHFTITLQPNLTLTKESQNAINAGLDPLRTEDIGIEAEIEIEFATPREFILFLVRPIWGLGRLKFQRAVRISWGFERYPEAPPGRYHSKAWTFPDSDLRGGKLQKY